MKSSKMILVIVAMISIIFLNVQAGKKLSLCELVILCDSQEMNKKLNELIEASEKDESINLNPFQTNDAGETPKEISERKFRETNCDTCWQLARVLDKEEDKCIDSIRKDFPFITRNFARELAKDGAK